MPILSLIAAPGALEPALVSNLMGAFGATGEGVWLSPDEAVEFPVKVPPPNLVEVRASLFDRKVDVNCLPAENRKKKLLIADMDSTMIQQECIDELAAEAGVGAHVAAITARAMNGELDFEAAIIERVALLKDLPTSTIDTVLQTRITYMPGGETLVKTMKANHAYAALVSGGFTQFTEKVGAALGFDETRANRLLEDGDRLLGEVGRPILGRDAKVAALRELVADPADAIAVGDGANDLGMIGIAGMGVALHAKPVVAEAAPLRIDHGDLTSLLFLQGYARSEFVA